MFCNLIFKTNFNHTTRTYILFVGQIAIIIMTIYVLYVSYCLKIKNLLRFQRLFVISTIRLIDNCENEQKSLFAVCLPYVIGGVQILLRYKKSIKKYHEKRIYNLKTKNMMLFFSFFYKTKNSFL